MALKATGNGSGLISTSPAGGETIRVRVLQGTYIASLDRDVEVGEVVTISLYDFKFLGGYKYVEEIDDNEESPDEKAFGTGRRK